MPMKRAFRRKGGKRSSATMSLTPSQQFEKELASRKDICVVKGSFLLTSSTVAINTTSMNPKLIGGRPGTIAPAFARFRLLRLVVKILPPTTSSGAAFGPFGFGVLDDVGVTADTPATLAGIAQLRCNVQYGYGVTVPTELVWNPVDPRKWYYVDTESSGDPRLQIPCELVYNVSTGAIVAFQVFYTFEFEGASSNA